MHFHCIERKAAQWYIMWFVPQARNAEVLVLSSIGPVRNGGTIASPTGEALTLAELYGV